MDLFSILRIGRGRMCDDARFKKKQEIVAYECFLIRGRQIFFPRFDRRLSLRPNSALTTVGIFRGFFTLSARRIFSPIF